jgi:hypothetical protein
MQQCLWMHSKTQDQNQGMAGVEKLHRQAGGSTSTRSLAVTATTERAPGAEHPQQCWTGGWQQGLNGVEAVVQHNLPCGPPKHRSGCKDGVPTAAKHS